MAELSKRTDLRNETKSLRIPLWFCSEPLKSGIDPYWGGSDYMRWEDGDEELSFARAKFEVFIRDPSGDVEKAIRHNSQGRDIK